MPSPCATAQRLTARVLVKASWTGGGEERSGATCTRSDPSIDRYGGSPKSGVSLSWRAPPPPNSTFLHHQKRGCSAPWLCTCAVFFHTIICKKTPEVRGPAAWGARPHHLTQLFSITKKRGRPAPIHTYVSLHVTSYFGSSKSIFPKLRAAEFLTIFLNHASQLEIMHYCASTGPRTKRNEQVKATNDRVDFLTFGAAQTLPPPGMLN